MCGKIIGGADILSTVVVVMAEIIIVVYTVWSARGGHERKRIVMDKAMSIERKLDAMADEIVFCHNPVYHFVKAKINAAVRAMDRDNYDTASEYFTDALLLIGPNRKVLTLLKSNLPGHIIEKIKENYGKYCDY